jgi:hypothetical protein
MQLNFKSQTAFEPQNGDYTMIFDKGPCLWWTFTEADARNLIACGNAEPLMEGNDAKSAEGQGDAGKQPAGNDSLGCPAGCNDGKPYATPQALAAHRRSKGH